MILRSSDPRLRSITRILLTDGRRPQFLRIDYRFLDVQTRNLNSFRLNNSLMLHFHRVHPSQMDGTCSLSLSARPHDAGCLGIYRVNKTQCKMQCSSLILRSCSACRPTSSPSHQPAPHSWYLHHLAHFQPQRQLQYHLSHQRRHGVPGSSPKPAY